VSAFSRPSTELIAALRLSKGRDFASSACARPGLRRGRRRDPGLAAGPRLSSRRRSGGLWRTSSDTTSFTHENMPGRDCCVRSIGRRP